MDSKRAVVKGFSLITVGLTLDLLWFQSGAATVLALSFVRLWSVSARLGTARHWHAKVQRYSRKA